MLVLGAGRTCHWPHTRAPRAACAPLACVQGNASGERPHSCARSSMMRALDHHPPGPRTRDAIRESCTRPLQATGDRLGLDQQVTGWIQRYVATRRPAGVIDMPAPGRVTCNADNSKPFNALRAIPAYHKFHVSLTLLHTQIGLFRSIVGTTIQASALDSEAAQCARFYAVGSIRHPVSSCTSAEAATTAGRRAGARSDTPQGRGPPTPLQRPRGAPGPPPHERASAWQRVQPVGIPASARPGRRLRAQRAAAAARRGACIRHSGAAAQGRRRRCRRRRRCGVDGARAAGQAAARKAEAAAAAGRRASGRRPRRAAKDRGAAMGEQALGCIPAQRQRARPLRPCAPAARARGRGPGGGRRATAAAGGAARGAFGAARARAWMGGCCQPGGRASCLPA